MVETDVDFKPEIKKDKVVINTKVFEKMDFNEYINACRSHNLEYQKMENSLYALQAQLKNMGKTEEDDEIKKFVELTKKAKKYEAQEKLIEDIKNLEELRMKKKKMIDSFNPLAKEIEKNNE